MTVQQDRTTADVTTAEKHRRGTPGYRRITWGLFAAGLSTFVALYCTQALLPSLTTAFHLDPATSALAVSVATGAVALAIIPASTLSERFGRTRVMTIAAVASAVIGLLLPLSPTFPVLLIGRALQGIALAGVPAVAMAYLAEEVHGTTLGAAMGRYIAGNTIGGLLGRLIPGSVLDLVPGFAGWRWALGVTGLAATAFTVLFLRWAEPSRFFVPRRIGIRSLARQLAGHLRTPSLLALFALAFVLMGGFVSVYNFVGFRLTTAPFDLPQGIVGLVFLLYLSGTWSSAAAGRWADRFGRPTVLLSGVVATAVGLLLTLPDHIGTMIPGLLLFTAGFFAAHSVASSWVGSIATEHRAQASSLYLFGYYLGSAAAGAAGGVFWSASGWAGVVLFVGALLIVGIGLAVVITATTRIAGKRVLAG
ncbi:MFS transporter [Nakamurella sp. YIM 132087]|uniref:MFS transporter n=1 Tax=Nakamurella alba TaxID=2665158 RepID=A0A7K1FG53_9ACTN|nr:MFS transporter [Nakamurella alba]MTD13077.1 MFS transporter [Nakamurella alba]